MLEEHVLGSVTETHLWCQVTSNPSGSSAVDEATSSVKMRAVEKSFVFSFIFQHLNAPKMLINV